MKKLVHILGLDSHTGIPDPEFHNAVPQNGGDLDFPLPGELDRVVDQVDDDLLHPPAITDDRTDPLVNPGDQAQTFLLRQRFDRAHRRRHRLLDYKFLPGDLELPGFDLGKIENVIDQGQQVLGALLDHPQLLALLLIQRTRDLLEDDPGEADDGVEGGAQLVGHRGQKD